MSNYPPGTGPNDPRAPWNAPEPVDCPDCRSSIGSGDDHDPGCPMAGNNRDDLERMAYEQHMEDRMDERRLREIEEAVNRR